MQAGDGLGSWRHQFAERSKSIRAGDNLGQASSVGTEMTCVLVYVLI